MGSKKNSKKSRKSSSGAIRTHHSLKQSPLCMSIEHKGPLFKHQPQKMIETQLFAPLPHDIHLDDDFTLNESDTWTGFLRDASNVNYGNIPYYNIGTENNEISKFIYDFSIFQYENNIGMVSDTMDSEKWIEVDTFIFRYIYNLACENKIKKVIYDYGIAKGLTRLFDFYKKELCIGFLQEDAEIMEYISNQSDSSINTDMTIAILRESIGFTSHKGVICN